VTRASGGCDLERLYGALSAQVPTEPGQLPLLFTSESLAVPDRLLRTDRLRAGAGEVYDERRYDVIELWADAVTYRRFAILLLAVAICPVPYPVELDISGTGGSIKRIRIEGVDHSPVGATACRSGEDPCRVDLWTRPTHFRYRFDSEAPDVAEPHERIFARLTLDGQAETLDLDSWWGRRDTLNGFGAPAGCLALGASLLNFAAASERDTLPIWDAGVFGAVRPNSAEMKFFCRDRIHEDEWPEAADG
jgi:hypothetical protein